MARSSRLLVIGAFAVAACVACGCGRAFLPGQTSPERALRGATAFGPAAAAALAASLPGAAGAFVYNGKEYFDVFFGIDPAWWAFLGFAIVYCGAVLKNAVEKYNVPKTGAALKPPKTDTFVGKEVEFAGK
mmetsp:Transcript_77826/g.216192  ORF Transcript_77826/g.216192 Transcript_77826/m.216192 type:complete len:131 (-) Transcript_77826:113-505(-)